MAQCSEEVIFEGWLTKSPPTTRLWRAKWRRRWFILTHSNDIPGQYILSYYTDRNRRKFKGDIYLDQCEQVDLGLKLKDKNLKFDYIFDITTPKRIYYLAADTEDEMKLWVTYISQACGLKPINEEADVSNLTNDVEIAEEHTSTSIISRDQSNGAYIPISECLTGKWPVFDSIPLDFKQNRNGCRLQNNYFYEFHSPNEYVNYSNDPERNYVNDIPDPRYYDSPRQLIPLRKTIAINNSLDVINGNKTFKKNEGTVSPCVTRQNVTSCVSEVAINEGVNNPSIFVPPRPPKPTHITRSPCYLNLASSTSQINYENNDKQKINEMTVITDDTYDFPRSHNIESEETTLIKGKHCYNNAAPVKCSSGGIVFKYDISPQQNPSTTVFKYDLKSTQNLVSSPAHSPSYSSYCNLPSPILIEPILASPPPAVNRQLKPYRKLSETNHLVIAESSLPHSAAPVVDRKLKPSVPLQELKMRKSLLDEDSTKRTRAAPSPIPPNSTVGEDLYQNESEIYHYVSKHMQYLDLDMQVLGTSSNNTIKSLAPKSLETNTVYKEVDFKKTEAFNLTRNNLEKERQEPVTTFAKK